MGRIKKITNKNLLRESYEGDIYPVTAIKAVYDEKSEGLNHILDRNTVINISTNYNDSHIAEVLTKEDCIAKIPEENRVLGFQGKYLSNNGWYSIAFMGDKIADWNNSEKWTTYPLNIEREANRINSAIDSKANIEDVQLAIKDLEGKIGDRTIVEGNVTNNPDDEDISTRNIEGKEVLSFNDRAYNPLSFSGKGYKILRKNLQLINGAWKNVLTQDMINDANTIYEVRYDFDLNGEEIEIKEGSTLSIKGGSFENGRFVLLQGASIKGTDSLMKVKKVTLRGDNIISDVTIDGEMSCNGVFIYGDNITIQRCKILNTKYIDSSLPTVSIRIGDYYTSKEAPYKNINIESVQFDTCEPFDTVTAEEKNSTVARFILAYNALNVTINNCTFKNLNGIQDSDMIQLSTKLVEDKNIPFYSGTSITSGNANPYKGTKYDVQNAVISNNTFYQSFCKSALKIMASDVSILNNTIIYSNNNERNSYALIRVYYAENITISGNVMLLKENTKIRAAIEVSSCKNVNVTGNSIIGISFTCNKSILYLVYDYILNINNNSIIVNVPHMIYNEHCFQVSVMNNMFNSSYTPTSDTVVDFFFQEESHYTYPSNQYGHFMQLSNNDIKYGEDCILGFKPLAACRTEFINNTISAKGEEFYIRVLGDLSDKSCVYISNNKANNISITIDPQNILNDLRIVNNSNVSIVNALKVNNIYITANSFTKYIKNVNYILRFYNCVEATVRDNYFDDTTISTKIRVENGGLKLNFINNISFTSISSYTPSGSFSGGIYVPSTILQSPFDYGSESEKDSMSSKFSLTPGLKYRVFATKKEYTWNGSSWISMNITS